MAKQKPLQKLQENLKRRINAYIEEMDPGCDLEYLWNKYLFFPVFHNRKDIGFIAYDMLEKENGIVCSVKILFVDKNERHKLKEVVRDIMKYMIASNINSVELEFASKSMSKWFQRYVENEPVGFLHKVNPFHALRVLEG